MAAHRETGFGIKPACAGPAALRAVMLGFLAVAIAVGLSLEPPATTVTAPPASGVVGPGLLPVGSPDSQEARIDAKPLRSTAAIAAASTALVPFTRTSVKTVSKDGKPGLNVARSGQKRPPAGFLMSPLETLAASSAYGYRISPISGEAGDFHLGQDFAAPCGTRVYSADAGVVRAAGWHPWGGGNRVELDHGNGLITTYNHLEAVAVKTGQSVEVGQVIARVGTTGWSTGCHLHFETIQDGQHVDPQRWTLIPIQQLDQLENIDMVDFGEDRTKGTTTNWALPATDHGSHAVVGGAQELPSFPATDPGQSAATPTPTDPTPSPTATSSPTPTPTPTDPAPSPTSPTPSPTPTGTATPSPTPTSPTPSPTPTGTATPSPTATTALTTPEPTPSETTTDQIAPSPTPTSTTSDDVPVPSESSPPAGEVPYAVQPENTPSSQP